MSNLPDLTNNEEENLRKAGQKTYSAAIRTGVTGGIVSFVLALLAIATLFKDVSDSAGLDFFVLGFLAIAVFTISGFTVILISLAGVVNYATMLNRNKDLREESINGITKSISLIIGVIIALLIGFKIMKIIFL